MRAVVRSVDANDVPEWPEGGPADTADGRQWFSVVIGAEGGAGGDLFEVCIASEAWFRRCGTGPFVGLVSPRFDADSIRATIEAFVSPVSGGDWHEIAARLSAKMRWEFAGLTAVVPRDA